VFENRVLRGIFGPKRDEVTGEWRKLHNDELHDLYCSPTTVSVMKPRMRWEEYVARMGRGEVCTGFWWENPREKPLGRLRCRRRRKWMFRKWDVGIWTGLSWLRIDRWRIIVYVVMNPRVP
jgi:hypothetical protein